MIEAKVIRDSVSDHGARLTTIKLRYPKFIHGEFMTHRVFSRNASSSRAVSTRKLLAEVRSRALQATPVHWGSNQPGMQAGDELTGSALELVQAIWAHAASDAAYHAERMLDRGVHKQIVNRIIEPFTHINVVVTATEWANFFGLRLDRAAQPEMRALAEAMWAAYNESVPLRLGHGQWHLPFLEEEDLEELTGLLAFYDGSGPAITFMPDVMQTAIKVSVARCARVSYESHETGRRSTVEEDVSLYERLRKSGHWSPFEHVATPDGRNCLTSLTNAAVRGETVEPTLWTWQHPEEHGNFVGWRQHRKMIPGEAVRPLPEEHRT